MNGWTSSSRISIHPKSRFSGADLRGIPIRGRQVYQTAARLLPMQRTSTTTGGWTYSFVISTKERSALKTQTPFFIGGVRKVLILRGVLCCRQWVAISQLRQTLTRTDTWISRLVTTPPVPTIAPGFLTFTGTVRKDSSRRTGPTSTRTQVQATWHSTLTKTGGSTW